MSSPRQVVVIGLDGVSPWLLDRLVDDGQMPRLAELRETGSYGRMRSSVNMMTPSAWTSMVTGVNPGRHGLFDFIRFVPSQHSIAVPTSLDRKAGAIWDLLGDLDAEGAILRFPMTFPARPMAGITVSDYLAPSPLHPRFTWPADLRKDILLKFGALGWVQEPMTRDLSSSGHIRRFVRTIQQGVKRSFDLVDYALEQERFALVFAVVSHTDTLLHRLVPLFAPDRARPQDVDALPAGTLRAAVSVFRDIDERLGALMDRVGSDADVILVSDHGLAPTQPGPQNLLRALLIELGYLGWEEAEETGDRSLPGRLRRLKSVIAGLLPWQLKRLLAPITEQARAAGAEKENLAPIVWEETDALVLVPNPATEIWLNLARRSPRGRVHPEDEGALEAELIEVIGGATNGLTGERAVRTVMRRDECVHGPWSHHVADLLAIFEQDGPCEELIAHAVDGTEVRVTTGSPGACTVPFAGHHEPWGFVAAHGPRIARGVADVECDVSDLMPTLAYILSGRVPQGLDGRLIEEMIDPEALRGRPPESGPPVPPPREDEGYEYTEAERAEVEGRLKDLGYL